MKILDIITAPWAIQEDKLREIQSIYETHVRGEKIDIKAVEAAIGRPLQNDTANYDVRDGVAVISLHGVIAKRMNMFTQISGGVSTELAARDIRAAIDDPAVHSIVLSIDSPGGTVDGVQALAHQVLAARARKPIVALADGTMASAAYYIGSAASRVYVSDGMTQVGSIGVVATHVDVSQADAKAGINRTEIYAGKYKRIASNYKPLSDEGRASMQDMVDYFYSVFVADVAAQRGVSVEQVLADMADGRIFIGQQAVDAGLADGVATLDQIIAQLNDDRAIGAKPLPRGDQKMAFTREQIEAEAADIVAAIRAEGVAAGTQQGAAAERERIAAVESQLMPGHEALINTLKFDGKTTGPEAAVAILAAEKRARADALANLRADTPPVVNNPPPPADAAEGVATSEEQATAQWEASEALRGEFASAATYWSFCQVQNKSTRRK